MTECKMLDNIKNGDLLVLDLDFEFDPIVIKWDNHEVCGKYVYDKMGHKDFEVSHIVEVIDMSSSMIYIDDMIDKISLIKKEITCQRKN